MNFKKGFSRAQRPAAPSQPLSQAKGSGVSLSGFSFKQLEEDEDGEDLTSYTGKYEKIVEQSQRTNKKDERSMSTSSVSSTSSGHEDLKPERNNSASQSEKDPKFQSKVTPPDLTGSPLRVAARQRIETSKELFSGLKGKIADKISKTIDEFSGDQSPRASPENEIAKAVQGIGNVGDTPDLVVKETVPILRGAPPEQNQLRKDTDIDTIENDPEQSKKETEKVNVTKEKLPLSAKSSVSEEEVADTASGPSADSSSLNLNSVCVEDHPLAVADGEDEFEEIGEYKEILSGLENSEYHNPQNTSPADILMFVEHFDNVEDSSHATGFSTSTKVKSRSVIKRLGKKERKTSAVATMSALHDTPDEEIVAPDTSAKSPVGDSVSSEKISEEKKRALSLNIPQSKSLSAKPSLPVGHGVLSLDPWSLPYQKLIAVAVILFAYMIVPLPSYMSGFIMGVLLASAGWALYAWLTEPPKPPEPFILPPLEEAPPVPEMKITTESEEFTYKVSLVIT